MTEPTTNNIAFHNGQITGSANWPASRRDDTITLTIPLTGITGIAPYAQGELAIMAVGEGPISLVGTSEIICSESNVVHALGGFMALGSGTHQLTIQPPYAVQPGDPRPSRTLVWRIIAERAANTEVVISPAFTV